MRLEKCHIENFGKLSDLTIDFTPGCNVINQENGWGKSTLADFIRVMFYGFANERTRKSDYDNERKRYMPWQGGVYGGQITFCAGGRRYILSRQFGTREKDDSFELRNADTNMVCEDFTTDIGQELFHINRESFQKTVFISHNDCETASTDDIHAKIGNLAEYTDDIKNYQQVDQKLGDLINAMSQRRKTGSLYKKKEEIQMLTEEIRQGQGIQQAITQKEQLRSQEKEMQQALQQQVETLQQEQKRLSRMKDDQSIREQYEAKKTEVSERLHQVEQSASVFPEEIPQREELEKVMGECSRLAQLENACRIYQMDPETEAQWQRLSVQFADGSLLTAPEEIHRQIAEWEQCLKQQEELERRQTALEAEQEQRQKEQQQKQEAAQQAKSPAWLAAGVILAILGLVLLLLKGALGIIPLLAAVGCMAVGIFWGRIRKTSQDPVHPEQDLTGKQQALEQERRELSQRREQVKHFCQQREIPFEPYQISGSLMQLEHQQRQYREWQEKRKNYQENTQKYEELSRRIRDYISRIGFSLEEDMAGQLRQISRLLENYQSAEREYGNAEKRLQEFEQSHTMAEIPEPKEGEEMISLEEITSKIQEINDQIQQKRRNIISYDRQLEQDREAEEELREKGNELGRLQEEFEQEKRKLGYIEKTRQYLEAAKESFTSRHMEPVMGAFRKYYRMLTGSDGEEFHIDANMNITISRQGMQREMQFFSAGYRDLMGLCLRMAFVQAMYQEEKPFILMDDPFVNLDEEKGNAGLELVREIAAEYQVIYFTCRRERDVNNSVPKAQR